jgi:phenylpropionate dioxygenase-like ring-hydroxylating dioxygenase large terminal subunit
MLGRFPFSPYPSGWFRVHGSDQLLRGQVKSLHYFGRDLVLFRGAGGEATLLDAHCPHLGAHLGLGSVVGDRLECRFHGWRFDTTGRCTDIPNDGIIPAKSTVSRWPITESNGVIMAYYDPEGRNPTWQFPQIAEARDPSWTGFRDGPRWPRIRTHVQEMLENGMDISHFSVLHRQQTLSAESLTVDIDGPLLVHRTFQKYNLFGLAKLFVDEVTGPLDVSMIGLGAVVNRTTVNARVNLSYAFAFFFTPIDEEHIEVNSMLSMRRLRSRILTSLLMKKAIREGRATIDQDIPIWETKRYREHPMLTHGERPIMQFRRWASQFYNSNVDILPPTRLYESRSS